MTLTTLWAEGKTAGQVSSALPGKSRNAVLGKIHRMKLAARETPIKPAKVKVPKGVRANRIAKPKAGKEPKTKNRAYHFGTGPLLPLADPLPPRAEAWEPLPGSTPVTIMDHTNGCRWPIGDTPLYCNLPCAEKPPKTPTSPITHHVYCAVHTRMRNGR